MLTEHVTERLPKQEHAHEQDNFDCDDGVDHLEILLAGLDRAYLT